MLSSLRSMIASSPITWTTRHVAGHQDDDPTHPLDWWALQNIQMDNLAKVFWMQHSHSEPVLYPLRDEGFQVWLGTRKLSSHSPSVFFDHIHDKTILNWHSSHHLFLLATPAASTGTPAPLLYNAFHWADAVGFPNIPRVSAQ
jgi:hypothetical protein